MVVGRTKSPGVAEKATRYLMSKLGTMFEFNLAPDGRCQCIYARGRKRLDDKAFLWAKEVALAYLAGVEGRSE